MVPYVELPLVTPFTVQVTAVLLVLATAAVIAKVPFTGTLCALVGLVMETATAGGVVEVDVPPPPQPHINPKIERISTSFFIFGLPPDGLPEGFTEHPLTQ